MFGRRKKTVKVSDASNNVSTGEDADSSNVELAISQVFHLAKAAFIARGFPDNGIEFIANQIAWLEARRLPALTCLTAEFTYHNTGVWNQRQPRPDSNNQMVFDCPFISGIILEDYFDQLVHPDPDEVKGIMGPTNPLLVVPRVARYAQKIGAPIHVYFKGGEPIQFVGRITTDGDKVLVEGDLRNILLAKGLSFSRVKASLPEEAHGEVLERVTIGEGWMLKLAEFIARDEVDARPYQ